MEFLAANWLAGIMLVATIGNVTGLILGITRRRRFRKALDNALVYETHARAYDELLSSIVMSATVEFVKQRPERFVPAWMRSMGHIEISVQTARKMNAMPDEDDEDC